MSTTDTAFYRNFAARVRTQLTTPVLPEKGAPTMDTTATAETTEAPVAPVPATFLPGPQATACDNAWCTAEDTHNDCSGPVVYLPARSWEADPGFPVPSVLAAQLYYDREDGGTVIDYDRGADNWRRLHSGDELRAETARVRAHLARLDAMADQYDAIREAGGAVPAPAPGSGHLPWCAPGGCITHDGAATEHESAWNTLPNHGRHPGRTEPLLKSALYYSADFGDSPEVGVSFLGEGTTYTGPEADALIADFETFLAGLKAQRAQLDGAHAPAAVPGRTWTFTNRLTGLPQTFTCMTGCKVDHSIDTAQPMFEQDINCWAPAEPATLRLEGPGGVDEFEVLGFGMAVEPFSDTPTDRLPHMAVDVTEDHSIEDLDPDAFEKVTNVLQARVDAMRAALPVLVAARAEYLGRAR